MAAKRSGLGANVIWLVLLGLVVGGVGLGYADRVEKARIAEEARLAEEARVAEEARLAEVARQEAEARRLAADQRAAEAAAAAAEQRAKVEAEIAIVEGFERRWADAMRLLESTARIALPAQVKHVQDLRLEIERQQLETCANESLQKLKSSIDLGLEGYFAFMQKEELASMVKLIDAKTAMEEVGPIKERCKSV